MHYGGRNDSLSSHDFQFAANGAGFKGPLKNRGHVRSLFKIDFDVVWKFLAEISHGGSLACLLCSTERKEFLRRGLLAGGLWAGIGRLFKAGSGRGRIRSAE